MFLSNSIRTVLLIPLFLFAIRCEAATDFSQAKWEKITDEEGIRVFSWTVPGSNLLAFRAEADVNSPIALVSTCLVDVDRRHEWMPSLGENRILKIISPTERLEYMQIKTPFIIKDRDFVMDNTATFNPETGEVLFDFKSGDDAIVPPTSHVRGEIFSSFYHLRPINNGAATHVEFLAHVDPKGGLPRWIVNLFAEKNPLRTLKNLRTQAAKADVIPNQDVLDAFQGKGILMPPPKPALSCALPASPQKTSCDGH